MVVTPIVDARAPQAGPIIPMAIIVPMAAAPILTRLFPSSIADKNFPGSSSSFSRSSAFYMSNLPVIASEFGF
jgi:hypothetical protein